MTYIDPNAPLPPREVVVRREGGATGWFVAGAVAIVAMVAVAFMLTVGARTPSQDQIAQAQEQGRAVGTLEGAQTSRDDTIAPSADPNVQAPPAQPVN